MPVQTVVDQLGNSINIPHPPKRIISVVPSQTELLFYLGLDRQIVGITKFCCHPGPDVQSIEKIGGTKVLKLEKIKQLQPDLIIANKEENDKDQIESLRSQFPVWVSDIKTIKEAIEMTRSIGRITCKTGVSDQLAMQISQKFNKLEEISNNPDFNTKRTAYLIWRNPYMVAAKNTFIDEMLRYGGFENCFSQQTRYPEITIEDLRKVRPELIFLSSEPYPFKEKHIAELQIACPDVNVELVDGELFSWYGNRLLKSADYLQKLQQKFI